MENRSHAVVALIFLLALLIGSAIVAWWMQAGQKETRIYEIVTPHAVQGLQVQAPVNFKGIQVGTVRQIGFDSGNPEEVRVLIGLVKDVPVTTSTYAQLSSNGITGVSTIALRESRPNSPLLSTKTGNPARIPLRQGFMQQLESSAKKSISGANRVEVRLEQLLGKNNQQYINRALLNLDQATRKLDQLENQMTPILNALPPLLEAARKSLAQGSALMQESQADAVRLHSVMHSSQRLLDSLNDSVVPEVNQLTGRLSVTTRSLNDLVETLARDPNRALFGGLHSTPGPGEPGFRPPETH